MSYLLLSSSHTILRAVSQFFSMQMHYIGFVDTEDMNVVSGKRKYTSLVGYSSSKLAQVHSKVWHI